MFYGLFRGKPMRQGLAGLVVTEGVMSDGIVGIYCVTQFVHCV